MNMIETDRRIYADIVDEWADVFDGLARRIPATFQYLGGGCAVVEVRDEEPGHWVWLGFVNVDEPDAPFINPRDWCERQGAALHVGGIPYRDHPDALNYATGECVYTKIEAPMDDDAIIEAFVECARTAARLPTDELL